MCLFKLWNGLFGRLSDFDWLNYNFKFYGFLLMFCRLLFEDRCTERRLNLISLIFHLSNDLACSCRRRRSDKHLGLSFNIKAQLSCNLFELSLSFCGHLINLKSSLYLLGRHSVLQAVFALDHGPIGVCSKSFAA